MLRPSWQVALSIMMRHLPRRDGPPKVAVLGMGQPLRGDDAVGPIVARDLNRSLAGNESVLVADTGPAPENFTGPIRRFAPDLVLLIDAAQMDEPGGKIHFLDRRACSGLSASTHTLPPSVIAEYLGQEVGCEVALLGVQPDHTDLGSGLSDVVRSAANRVVAGVVETLHLHGITGRAGSETVQTAISRPGPGVWM